MTEPVALLLTLFLIYLSECIERLPPGSVLVRPRKQGPVRPTPWIVRFSPGLRVGLVNPIPWFAREIVLTGWPIAISPIGISELPKEDGDPARVLLFDGINAVSAERSELILNDWRVPVGSEQVAKQFAALIEKIRSAATDRRGHLIEEALRQDARPNLLRIAYARVWSQTRWLRAASAALFLFFFCIAPLVIAVRGITHTWSILLLVLLYLLALVLYEYRNTHRALFPALSSQRRSTLVKMAVAPTAAMRAVDGIQRKVMARFHPIAALAVPANEAEILRFLHERLRAETGLRPESGNAAITVLHWFRELEWKILEETAAAVGISRRDVRGAPMPASSAERAYCPRCRQQYVRPAGDCADCPGSKLVPFDATPDN